ncbi:EBNA-1 nuclear protein [marine bacterium AO1-C]|nr:EBNA-1 nuclear protein [marine bacterium AO1-C]
MSLTTIQLKAPYLIFIGDVENPTFAKTGAGIVQWRPELVAGQLRFAGNSLTLGVPDMTVQEAAKAGVKSIIIGVAPVGGKIEGEWLKVLEEAARLGLDVVSGLHHRLENFPGLVAATEKSGSQLVNVRTPAQGLPVGSGKKRSGKRLLMVGTDCAVGKKYTALAMAKSLQEKGVKASFRATGQTGIMIAGSGIPIDTVVTDFVSGAAEVLSPDNDKDHWDVIEGQGSILHPGYAAVSLGLLHGSQPDAFIVCHEPTRPTMEGFPQATMPTVQQCMEMTIQCGKLTNPAIRCIGISVNTSRLPAEERLPYLEKLTQETQLPCVDPILTGCEKLVTQLLATND